MICKVEKVIEKYALLENVKTVAVGVSGGADSIALLKILSILKEKYGIILKAVHVNHNIRGDEADADEALVKKYCEELDVEFMPFSIDVISASQKLGIGLEECGRIVRYECFHKASCDAVALAHTLSDSIETMLFNLARGTGSKGLCGIPVKREPNIIRPLIECTRKEIEQYCSDNNLQYAVDCTNLQDDYTRNYIRHNIVPLFERVNSDFEQSFLKTMQILTGENAFIEQQVQELLKASFNGNGYSTKLLKSAHPSVRQRAVMCIIEGVLNKSVEKRHIALVEQAIEKNQGKIELSKDLYICVNSDIICVQSKGSASNEYWEATEQNGAFVFDDKIYSLTVVCNPDTVEKDDIDFYKIQNTLKLTSRKQGDTFFNKKRGNTKTLKKLFCEMKIPLDERNKIAVLRDGENVVWVENIGTDSRYSPKPNAEKIIRVKKGG